MAAPARPRTTPRGLVVLKKFTGRLLGAEEAAGTPSQLISRRAPPNEPLAPATVPPPISERNWSRAGVIAAGFPLVAERVKIIGAGTSSSMILTVAVFGLPKPTSAPVG